MMMNQTKEMKTASWPLGWLDGWDAFETQTHEIMKSLDKSKFSSQLTFFLHEQNICVFFVLVHDSHLSRFAFRHFEVLLVVTDTLYSLHNRKRISSREGSGGPRCAQRSIVCDLNMFETLVWMKMSDYKEKLQSPLEVIASKYEPITKQKGKLLC